MWILPNHVRDQSMGRFLGSNCDPAAPASSVGRHVSDDWHLVPDRNWTQAHSFHAVALQCHLAPHVQPLLRLIGED
jgi:hypothetical protein